MNPTEIEIYRAIRPVRNGPALIRYLCLICESYLSDWDVQARKAVCWRSGRVTFQPERLKEKIRNLRSRHCFNSGTASLLSSLSSPTSSKIHHDDMVTATDAAVRLHRRVPYGYGMEEKRIIFSPKDKVKKVRFQQDTRSPMNEKRDTVLPRMTFPTPSRPFQKLICVKRFKPLRITLCILLGLLIDLFFKTLILKKRFEGNAK